MEAALVLPLLFLIILSMIGLCLFEFEGLKAQTDLHEDLLGKEMGNRLPVSVARSEVEVTRAPGGVVRLVLRHPVTGRCFCLREAEALRLQEVIGDGSEEFGSEE